jgi:hypothetical protein
MSASADKTVCEFCGEPVVPGADDTAVYITGWEKKRKAGGANMVHLRTEQDRYACSKCVDDAKPRKLERAREAQPTLDLSRKFTARPAAGRGFVSEESALSQRPHSAEWSDGTPFTDRERAFFEGDA